MNIIYASPAGAVSFQVYLICAAEEVRVLGVLVLAVKAMEVRGLHYPGTHRGGVGGQGGEGTGKVIGIQQRGPDYVLRGEVCTRGQLSGVEFPEWVRHVKTSNSYR